MNKIAIIIPTRERSHKIDDLHKQWFNVLDITCSTDCIIVLDEDNEQTYPRLHGFIYMIVKMGTQKGVNYPLNQAAVALCNNYEYIGFWGDDHFPRTQNWNSIMYGVLNANKPYAIGYGNDLLQKINLPTEVIMDSKYIQKLGYMSHPDFSHLFIDDFWKFMGIYMGNFNYMDDVVIEHLHYCLGKSPFDNMYAINNTQECFNVSRVIYYRVTTDPTFLLQLDEMKAEMITCQNI